METLLPTKRAWLDYWEATLTHPMLRTSECAVVRLIALVTRSGRKVYKENADVMKRPANAYFNLYMCAIAYHVQDVHGVAPVQYNTDPQILAEQLRVSREIRVFTNLVQDHGIEKALQMMPTDDDEDRGYLVPLLKSELARHIQISQEIQTN